MEDNNLYNLMGISPWGYEKVSGEFIIDNDKKEILTVLEIDDQYKISYYSFSKDVAEETLKDCPKPLEKWEKEIKKLKDISEYKSNPYFTGFFNQDDFLEAYFFLISKMEKTETPEENLN